MGELEVRELEYFVAVAEELHFGHAAQRLSIAQPALSKAIRRMETRLGVELLSRSSRHVALTPAGEALLIHGRHALGAVNVAVQSARQAGNTEAQLRLVIKPGGDANLLSAILAVYSHQPDARRVEVLFGGNFDRADYLRDGRADVALLYAPFDGLDGLASATLFEEGRVALLPRDHPLAGLSELELADLNGETFPRWEGMNDAGGDGPLVADQGQLNHLIALGRTVAVLPRSLATPVPPGLAAVPISDAARSRLVLAWPESNPSALVPAFVEAALTAVTAGNPAERGIAQSEMSVRSTLT